MIQISTPIQATSSNDNIRESGSSGLAGPESGGESPKIWGEKHKKGKQGVFAKLLEGLISRKKIGAAEPNSEKAEPAWLNGAGKAGKNSLKPQSTKKIVNFTGNEEGEAGDFDSGALSVESAVSAFFAKDVPQTEQGKKASVKTDDLKLKTEIKKEEFSLTMDFSDFDLNQGGSKEEVLVIPAGRGDDRQNPAFGRTETSPWLPGRDGAKNNGNFNFINVSFRETDADFSQAQVMVNRTNNAANEKESRPSEVRGKKNRFNLEVRDLRTGPEAVPDAQKVQAFNAAGKPLSAEIEIPVNLNLSGGKGDGSVKAGRENSYSKAFEDALARELRSGLSTDIVRDAAVILRNGGEGTVKLSLRPASLGDVKIRLEMTENKITGYIIVESSEALRAFERELPVLEKAFKDSGFSETNLEMSLAQDEQNFTPGGERQEGDFQPVSPMVAASHYESETDWIGDPPIEGGLIFSDSNGRTPVNLLV